MWACNWKGKRENKIRTEKLNELKEHIKNIQAADVIVKGDFNEDVCSNKIQNFMIERGLYDIFLRDIWRGKKYDRDSMFEHGSKCVDFF